MLIAHGEDWENILFPANLVALRPGLEALGAWVGQPVLLSGFDLGSQV